MNAKFSFLPPIAIVSLKLLQIVQNMKNNLLVEVSGWRFALI
jgi:hypothetical protein